jgi:hypothetical protein
MERKAPPAASTLDTPPISAPTPNSPAMPGSWREGFGLTSKNIRAAAKNMKPVKRIASGRVGRKPVASVAASAPATMPGAIARATRQSTAPWR